jgi:hypothetical protein
MWSWCPVATSLRVIVVERNGRSFGGMMTPTMMIIIVVL